MVWVSQQTRDFFESSSPRIRASSDIGKVAASRERRNPAGVQPQLLPQLLIRQFVRTSCNFISARRIFLTRSTTYGRRIVLPLTASAMIDCLIHHAA